VIRPRFESITSRIQIQRYTDPLNASVRSYFRSRWFSFDSEVQRRMFLYLDACGLFICCYHGYCKIIWLITHCRHSPSVLLVEGRTREAEFDSNPGMLTAKSTNFLQLSIQEEYLLSLLFFVFQTCRLGETGCDEQTDGSLAVICMGISEDHQHVSRGETFFQRLSRPRIID
jgi:hypothetical protein